MANQITIDIGAAANDGTGDPLRTAFNYVNNNFSNVWNTGLPNSNVQFLDNRILTVNTNANLVLAPNGVGKVASNVDIVPNTANVFALGGLTRRWNTIYGQYLDLSHNATIGGNLTVTGNLSAGNISYTSNVFVGDLEGSVFDGASSIVLDVIDSAIYVDNYRYANGSPVAFGGTPGGSNTQIQFNNAGSFGGSAAFTFNRASNVLAVSGNISAGNITVSNLTTTSTVYATTGTFTGDQYSDGAMYVGTPAGTVLGSDVVIQITANAGGYSQTNFQNINSGGGASSDYILTADNGNDTTYYLDLGITSSGWDGSETNVLSGLVANNGYLYVQDGNLTLGTRNGNTSYTWNFDTTGNLTVAGNIVPTGNNTQSLGNATRQWNDLYLSNATIYMNSVPISMTAGNVLTVNGNAVLQNNSNSTITTTGNITADTFFGSGVTATATNAVVSLNAFDTDGNTVSIQAQGNTSQAVIETYFEGANNRFTWSFDNSGTLTFPRSQTSIFGGYDNDLTINTSNANVGTVYTFTFSQFGDLSVPVNLDVSGNVYTNDIVGPAAGNVAITANTKSWLFDNNGTLTLPGNSQILPAGNTGVRLSAGASDATGLFLNNTGDAELYANSNVSVYTNGGNIGWTFDNTGNLALPNNGSINFAAGGIVQAADEDFTILVQDADDDGFSVYLNVDDGAGILLSQYQQQRDQYELGFPDAGVYYQFNDNGTMVLPANAGVWSDALSNVSIIARSVTDSSFVELMSQDNSDIKRSNVTVTRDNVTVTTSSGAYTWTFDNTGNLTAPGNIQAQNIRTVEDKVHIGQNAGLTSQGANAVSIGTYAGQSTQGSDAIAIGQLAGNSTQGSLAVAIGSTAGANTQGAGAVAVGYDAGEYSQGNIATALGAEAGKFYQSTTATAVGTRAGNWNQGAGAVAIGKSAAENISNSGSQGLNAVAIGNTSGYQNQGASAIAIGAYSGLISQGQYSIAIGDSAGRNSAGGQGIGNNSIILNATGANFAGTTANSFYVTPVRNDVSNIGEVVFYNTTSKEVTYGNTISVAGNVSGNYFVGNGSALTSITGANVTDTVAQATLANTVAVSSVLLNQEYVPALLVANTGNLGIKAADGLANITYNPAQNRLTVENIVVGNAITATGNISAAAVTASGKIGYSAGANVTQTTSRGTSVTLNALSGEITLVSATMAAGAVDTFTMTNNKVSADDMIVCTTRGGTFGTYLPMAYTITDTQVAFVIRNLDSSTTGSEAPVIKFVVIKAPKS